MSTSHTPDGWTTTPLTPDLLRGALDLERTALGLLPHRLPARARAQCPDGQLAMAEAQPSGVRLVLRTGPPSSHWTRCAPRTPTAAPRPAPTGSTTCSSTAT